MERGKVVNRGRVVGYELSRARRRGSREGFAIERRFGSDEGWFETCSARLEVGVPEAVGWEDVVGVEVRFVWVARVVAK